MYEGNYPYSRGLWPAPVVTHAKVIFDTGVTLEAERSTDLLGCRFREDQYDAIARVRRGRFYATESGRSQPAEWHVQPHVAVLNEQQSRKSLLTYASCSIGHRFGQGRHEQPLVLLGMDDGFTMWTILAVERISTGEELVTLKGRSTFGILPIVKVVSVPELFRKQVRERLDTLADEAHRSAPSSVIDRARDAANQVLLAYYGLTGESAQELSALGTRLERDDKIIAASVVKIVARLHARAKAVEQQRREMRPIREQDAEFAVQCVGALLCEIGWAEWA